MTHRAMLALAFTLALATPVAARQNQTQPGCGPAAARGGKRCFQSPNPISMDAATINSIVANPAGFYFNVHSTLNPGGVVRGQLRAQ